MPWNVSTFRASLTSRRPWKLTRFPAASTRPTPTELTPRPPICISAASTTWPKTVKLSKASMAIRPVTHTALVDVNSASM